MNKTAILNKIKKLAERNQKLFNKKALLAKQDLDCDIEIHDIIGEYDKFLRELME